jgi:hemoglobin
MTQNDICNRGDIDRLMNAFYGTAMVDPELSFIFNDVARLNLAHHLPIIGDFWETMLFRSGDYQRHGRNPITVHAELDAKTPLLPQHFDRWLMIFNESVDGLFQGERAELVKSRAAQIARRMLEFLGRAGGITREKVA